MKPTFEQINIMLQICDILLYEDYELKFYEEFIFLCPDKFLLTYCNNSVTTPDILTKLNKLKFTKTRSYLISYVHETKRQIWCTRIDFNN